MSVTTPAGRAIQQRNRDAMRMLLAEQSVGAALEDLTMSVAVAVVPDEHPDADHRMDVVARVAEAAVLDTLVAIAKRAGWRPPRT